MKNRVEADIRIWIEDYRLKTELTLGKVIKATFAQTSCSWYFDQEDVAPRGRPRRRSRSRTSERREQSRKRGKEKNKEKRKEPRQQPQPQPKTATKMWNGELLCKAWNAGHCSSKESDCKHKQRHLCSVIVKENGRVCGMHNHRAIEHKRGNQRRSN